MELTLQQEKIYSGKVCPYCDSETLIVTEEFVYGKSYKGRKLICCEKFPNCDSYVGTHEEDESSLGRLANKRLRQFKNRAHEHFDKLWKEEYFSRDEAYELLSEHLTIPKDYTHIGFFNEITCKKVIDWSIKTYKELKEIEKQPQIGY